MLESNQLKAELNENKRLLDLLKRKMMRDEEADEASQGGGGLVRMGDTSEESESEDENNEEEVNVLIQEDRWQELIATRPRMSV